MASRNAALFLGGGLLAGVGKGMVEQMGEDGRLARETLLEELRQKGRREEGERDREFRSGEAEKDRSFRLGLQTDRFADDQGLMWTRDASGTPKPVIDPTSGTQLKAGAQKEPMEEIYDPESPTGARLVPRSQAAGKPKGKPLIDESGMSPKDKNLWNVTKERHSKKDVTGVVNIDWNSMAEDLRARGRDDLADMASSPGATKKAEAAKIDAQIDKEAGERKSIFKPRSSEFPETAGSEEEWKARRREELTGGARPPTTPSPRQTPKQQGQLKGSGTKADPYKAATQSDIDYFKKNAPAGAVIEVGGKLYTK